MNVRNLLDSLSTRLEIIKGKLKLENSVNDLSYNIYLEGTYINILNEVYGYQLVNANMIQHNFPAVDAIDEKNGIYVQITSTCTKEKIEKTISLMRKNKLDEKYPTLIFFFLKGKKVLQLSTINKIKKISGGKLDIDYESNLLDNGDIYQRLFYEQDIQKISRVLDIINKNLGFIPDDKESGYEAISISFSNEIENAYQVVDIILKEGINVYTNSIKLYDKFRENKHRLFNYLIYINGEVPIRHIKYCVVILNDTYINENLQSDEIKCNLLKQALLEDNRIQNLSFSTRLNYKNIKNPLFKNWKTLSKDNLQKCLLKTISDLISDQNNLFFDVNYIKDELKRIHNNFILFELNKDEKKGYQLFQFTFQNFSNVQIFYIILNPGYVLNTVVNHFNGNWANKINKNLIILAPKDPFQKTRNRLENIKKMFNTNNVEYIQDHFFEKTFKSLKQDNILMIDDFIDPVIKDNDGLITGINGLLNWINTDSTSNVAIIKGQGGIGKTTLCKKIHDLILKDFEKYHVIFINSNELLKDFSRLDFNDQKEYEIYNIYEIWHRNIYQEGQELLDRNTFYINYSLGNILIIFDGIDEIISTITSFNLDSFLQNVLKIQENIGKGKIIINCRDSYINEVTQFYIENSDNASIDIEIFDLLPFNSELAENYFSFHFEKDQKINKAMSLLGEFVQQDNKIHNNFIYPPFVLEIVKQFIEKEFDEKIHDFTFNSKLLIEKDITDNIIYKTCFREISKKESNGFDLIVDKQVEFMINLSIEKRGFINEAEFIDILKNIKLIDRLDDFANGLKDHPFLIKKDDKFYLRFDFLNSYFKSLGILTLIKYPKNIKDSVLILLAKDCGFNSHITKYLIQKIKDNLSGYLISFRRLIDEIQLREISDEIKQKSISNLFQIIQQAYQNKTPAINKFIIQKLFAENSDEKSIDKLYLIDIQDSSKLIIDFSELFVKNSIIKNYPSFFNCIFSHDTLFDETCLVEGVFSSEIIYDKITADLDNFDSAIKGDNTIIKVLNMKKSDDGLGFKRLVINSIKLFFKCFYEGQNLITTKLQKDIIINYSLLGGPANIDKVISVLEKNKIIELVDNKILLNTKHKNKINKFIEGGLNYDFLNQVFISLNKEYK